MESTFNKWYNLPCSLGLLCKQRDIYTLYIYFVLVCKEQLGIECSVVPAILYYPCHVCTYVSIYVLETVFLCTIRRLYFEA